MKKFNFLSKLWSSMGNLQSSDVRLDRRLTVGSPSGFTINWTLKLVSVLVIVLSLGIGNVWGADAVVYTLTCPKSTSNSNYANNYNLTVSGIGWNAPGNQYEDGAWRIGGKSITKVDRKIYSTTAIANDISKIDVVFGASSGSITVNSVTLNVYSTAAKAAAGGTGDVSSSSITHAASSTQTVSVPSGKSWKGRFYGLTINVTVSGSNNKYVTLSAIKFYTPTYTVTYNANGGSGTLTDASSPYFKDATVTVKSNTFTRDGYTFNGWNTASGGSGTSYAAGATFSITANTTLYAQWEELSCTAPNHVDVSGAWDRFAGEQISLTATAYSSAGTGSPISAGDITGYQWYKGGTAEGNKIAGATSATYTKDNCTLSDAGDYYCKISTGATCSTMSSAFGVKVYALDCYTGGTATHNFTRVGATQTGTLELTLTASTGYLFKVRQGAVYLGNNGTINEDENTWTFTTSGSNVTVNSGLGGTFTFTLDYSSNADEPILAVTYPRKTIYLVPNSDWLSNSAKFAYYYYGASGGTGWTDFIEANACGMSAEIPQWNGLNVIAVRFNSSEATPGWNGEGHVWNQTSDVTITADKDLITITGWNNSQTYTAYSIPTYTISYNKGTNGTGTRDNDTKTCGTAFTLPNTQVFTRSGYTMDGWSTSDGGDKAYNLGGSYTTNAAQTFYPHWAIVNYTITYNLNGGTQQVSPAPATSYNINSSAITLPTPTREGYDFAGWYANSDLSTGGVQTSIAAGSTGNKTYWAKWTIKSYTVDWYVGGTGEEDKLTTGSQTTNVNHGSKVTTLPSTPSGSACDLTFIGWTNTTSYTHGTSVLFTNAAGSPAITSATNFYAVFAEGSAPATKSLTNSQITTFYETADNRAYANGPFTITSDDGNWYGVCAAGLDNAVNYVNIKQENVTISGNDTRPYLQSPVYSKDIVSVTLLPTHGSNSDRTLYICSGATSTPEDNNIGSITVSKDNSLPVTVNISSGVTQLYLYANGGAIMIKYIDVSVGGYFGHTLTCEPCDISITPTFTASPTGGTVAVSRSGVPVTSGSTVKTCGGVSFAVTITPDHYTLTNFTATVANGTVTISPDVASTLPKAVAQTFTVTVSDGAAGALTLTPTLTENAYRTVVFMSNNEALFDDDGEATTFDATNKWKQKVYVGEKPVLPTAVPAGKACDDDSNTFMGWVRDNQRWPGKSASGMPAGSTLITAASGFDAAAAGSGEIAYHAVWAQSNMESDVINNSATSSYLGSTSTSSWASDFTLTGSTGAQYYVHSMGTNGGSHALQWNSNGYLYCKKAPTSGKKLFSIAVTGTDSKNVGLYGNGSAYSANSGGTSLGTLATGSTYTFTDEYGYIRITGTASSTQITTLTITYGSYTNYMTTCCASTGLTLEGPTGDIVFITSTAEKKVRSQEAFHISGCGVSGSQTLTFDFGNSALNAKFTCETATGGTLVTTCDGRIDEDFYIYYTPGAGDTSDGIDKSTSLTASVGGTLSNDVTLDTKTIIGRHLPADFVIAGKKGGKWYALPATMSSTDHPAPVEIAVDDANDPSIAYTTASNKYGLEGPASGNISDGNGQYVKLTMHPLSDAPLFGQAPSNTGIGKSGTAIATNKLSAGYWWQLTQTNTSITNPQDAKYTIYCANNTSSLSIKNEPSQWGLYASASAVSELRLIPVSSTEFTESEVVAWGQEKLILEVAKPDLATQARAKLGNGGWSANKSLATTTGTSVNGTATKYNYTLDFTDEIDFAEAASEGKMLIVELLNSGGTALNATSVLVPRIIAADKTIKKATDASKTPWNTEVHVLPGVTLTVDASGYTSTDMTIAELNIYPGATVVAENGTLKATTLILRNGWDRLSATKKYDVARLYITPTDGSLQATNAYAEWYIDYDQYYPIAVPWTVTTSGMTYKNTSSAASAGVKIRYYDGASRASNVQNGVGEGANWKEYSEGGKAYPTTLTPGTGYAMTAKRPTGKAFSIIRMPLTIPSADWTTGGEKGYVSTTHKDQVSVTAHGNENTPAYAKGWNFIANPYMSLHQGALSYENSETVEYANIPDENFKEFDQQPILTTKLKPSSAFLIQAPATGVVTFATGSRKASAPQRYVSEAMEDEKPIQRAYILLADDQTEDMMGLLVSEKYSAEYEMNADLEKLLSDGNTLRTYMRYNDMNMAYLAINEELAKQLIPVSVRIPADGEYTFTIHEASIADELEGVYLTDYETGNVTNLLYDDYTFTASAGTLTNRFVINAIVGVHNTPTGLDITGADKDGPTKFIYHDKVYILHNNVIYDSTGKRVNVINK